MNLEPTESQLVNSVIRRCWLERSWLTVWRANAGKIKAFDENTGKRRWIMLNKPGVPDIIGFYGPYGKFIGLECKVGKNTQTDYQEAFESDCKDKSADYFIIRNMLVLEVLIESIRPFKFRSDK